MVFWGVNCQLKNCFVAGKQVQIFSSLMPYLTIQGIFTERVCLVLYMYLLWLTVTLWSLKAVTSWWPQCESIFRMIDPFERLLISDCEMMNYRLFGDDLETLQDWWVTTVASLPLLVYFIIDAVLMLTWTTFTEVQYVSDNLLIKYIWFAVNAYKLPF